MKRTFRSIAIIAVAASLGACWGFREVRLDGRQGREQRHGEERHHGEDRQERDGEHRAGGDRSH
jgi:hypothetical protein